MHAFIARTTSRLLSFKTPLPCFVRPRRPMTQISVYRTLWTPGKYPPTRRSEHFDMYKSELRGEVRVPNPYEWLEQPTQETEEWTSQQDAFTRQYLDQNPDRQKLEDEMRANSDFAKVHTPPLCPRTFLNPTSSRRRLSKAMAAGIGTTTVVYRRSRVRQTAQTREMDHDLRLY